VTAATRPGERPVSGTVLVDGVDLYYEIHGHGPPLVLLHGAMGTIASCFTDLLPLLAAARTVVAVELQGHGHTPDVADRPLSYGQLAADVAGLIGALELGPVDVIGYSLGGGVALQLAMSQSELCRHIIFAGGASYRRDGLHPEMLDMFDGDPPDLTGTPWHDAYLRVAPNPEQWTTLVAKSLELDRTFEGWTANQVRAVAVPVLLVIGDADIVRPEHTVEMFRLLGGGVNGDLGGVSSSRLAVLPGTSHTGVLDRAKWLASMALDFIDG
jgi:pimeloyl-ACP methyl ester carboxylesterase